MLVSFYREKKKKPATHINMGYCHGWGDVAPTREVYKYKNVSQVKKNTIFSIPEVETCLAHFADVVGHYTSGGDCSRHARGLYMKTK